MNLEWQIAWSFHLDSIVHHLPYQLFHFAPGEAGSFLFGADTWSVTAVLLYLHAYTLFQWNCLLEHEERRRHQKPYFGTRNSVLAPCRVDKCIIAHFVIWKE